MKKTDKNERKNRKNGKRTIKEQKRMEKNR